MKCTVCHHQLKKFYKIIDNKKYWKCNECFAIILDNKHYLNKLMEKKHYLKHQNIVTNLGYRNFLSKLSTPLIKDLKNGDEGLDFGCGHGPALADILNNNGFNVELYDPFFYPNKNILSRQYDFITCTETVEHFFDPFKEFTLLNKLLKKNGLLAIMTSFLPKEDLFENWYYRRDPTHVVFYAEKTFTFIAKKMSWIPEIKCKNVIFFKKNN